MPLFLFYLKGGTTMGITLQDEKIIDRWSMIIEGGQGRAEQVYQDTGQFIKDSKAPGMSIERVKVRTSWLKGLFGNERVYMMVTNDSLGDYRMFIGARDYGAFPEPRSLQTAGPKRLWDGCSPLPAEGR
jgi:hypothetical protein